MTITNEDTGTNAPTVAPVMKAAVIDGFGDFDVLHEREVGTPRPGPGHVLVRVLAAGVNRLDHYLREGSITPDIAFPHVLGADAAGEVAALGDGVTELEIGERVIPIGGYPTNEAEYGVRPIATAPSFTLPGMGVWGTYAQYIEVPAAFVIKDTTGLEPAEVATLPMVLASSVRAVRVVGRVRPGDRVLVQAGASGSGSMQIQVAKALGARVATTVRDSSKGELASSIGADLVIDVRHSDPVEVVKAWTDERGVDVAIDNLGGDVLRSSIDAVRPLGVVVAYGFAAGTEVSFDVRDLFFGQKELRGTMAGDPEDLAWGLEQVRAGRIRPLLDRTFPLGEAARAHERIATNEVKGNLVLLPWD